MLSSRLDTPLHFVAFFGEIVEEFIVFVLFAEIRTVSP